MKARWTGLVLAVVYTLAVPRVNGQAPDTALPSTQDGVFTEEQAQRGARVNERTCAQCHMEEWFTGTLLQSWSGARVSALYDVIRATMPEDRPGSLKPQEYADLLAYIFQLNGLPSGTTELEGRKEVLENILIERSK